MGRGFEDRPYAMEVFTRGQPRWVALDDAHESAENAPDPYSTRQSDPVRRRGKVFEPTRRSQSKCAGRVSRPNAGQYIP